MTGVSIPSKPTPPPAPLPLQQHDRHHHHTGNWVNSQPVSQLNPDASMYSPCYSETHDTSPVSIPSLQSEASNVSSLYAQAGQVSAAAQARLQRLRQNQTGGINPVQQYAIDTQTAGFNTYPTRQAGFLSGLMDKGAAGPMRDVSSVLNTTGYNSSMVLGQHYGTNCICPEALPLLMASPQYAAPDLSTHLYWPADPSVDINTQSFAQPGRPYVVQNPSELGRQNAQRAALVADMHSSFASAGYCCTAGSSNLVNPMQYAAQQGWDGSTGRNLESQAAFHSRGQPCTTNARLKPSSGAYCRSAMYIQSLCCVST